ncbi:MAG: endonuclease/exonuclease/phosphatase family protein [bacterium]
MKKTILIIVLVLASLTLSMGAPRADSAKTVSILTYNVFDPFFGPMRGERIQALPEAIMALTPIPDVMVFEEFFRRKDRRALVQGLRELGYPLQSVDYYDNHGYGSGIMVISRYSISSAAYTPYPVDGDWFDPEKYSGKGVHLYCFDTPYGPLKIFATHPISRFKPLYNEDGTHNDRDRRIVDRLLEMEYLARFIQKEMSPQPIPGKDLFLPPARSFVLCGDLNASPDMWSYQFLRARTGVSDSFADLHPREKASTYSPENTMVSGSDFGRIDHILYKNIRGESGFWLKPGKSEIVFNEAVELSSGTVSHLSDHFGVMTVFKVIRDRDRVELGPRFWPPESEERPLSSDLTAQGIRLTPTNHLAWQNWAVDIMAQANRRRNRYRPEVIPAARTVIHREVSETDIIPLTKIERLSVRARLFSWQ